MRTIAMVISLVAAGITGGAQSHPGGRPPEGCDNNRKNGGRHCYGFPLGLRLPSGRNA